MAYDQLGGRSQGRGVFDEVMCPLWHVPHPGLIDLAKAHPIALEAARPTHAVRRLLGELAGSPELGAVSLETIEVGIDSDRGSERMRAELWDHASAECRRIKSAVEASMAANLTSVEAIADALVDAADLTLSGPVLGDLLASLDLALLPTALTIVPTPTSSSASTGG